jgi:hypothetical protein
MSLIVKMMDVADFGMLVLGDSWNYLQELYAIAR